MTLQIEARVARLETLLELFLPEEILERGCVRAIQRLVAEFYGLSREDLLSQRRARKYSYPRQMAMALVADRMPHLTYGQMSRLFGNRDRTTIMYGINKIRDAQASPRTQAEFNSLSRACRKLLA